MIVLSCTPKIPAQIVSTSNIEEKEADIKNILNDENIFVQYNIFHNNVIQESSRQRYYVTLPFEITIIDDIKLIVYNNGTFDLGSKKFTYMEIYEDLPFEDDVVVSIYHENNLLGVNISIQYLTGGNVLYTHVINIETLEDIPFKDQGLFILLKDFFSIDNIFIAAFNKRAYGFDDNTGDLLWTQTYNLQDGEIVIINDDHFVIDDKDGNKYRIYGDGRKDFFNF